MLVPKGRPSSLPQGPGDRGESRGPKCQPWKTLAKPPLSELGLGPWQAGGGGGGGVEGVLCPSPIPDLGGGVAFKPGSWRFSGLWGAQPPVSSVY